MMKSSGLSWEGHRAQVAVVGGGFAGAAAASALAEAGYAVTLLEERKNLGGRTVSLRDGVTKEDVDTGPHLFLGSYGDTRRFLDRLGLSKRLVFGPAHLLLVDGEGRTFPLRFDGIWGRWGVGWGLLRYKALSVKERCSLLGALASLLRRQKLFQRLSVAGWLKKHHQSRHVRNYFWDPLCLAVLNQPPEHSAMAALAVALKESFLSGGDLRFGHAAVSLSRLWPVELPAYLRARGSVVAFGQKVTGFETAEGRVRSVRVVGGEAGQVDAVVCAVPMQRFPGMAPEGLGGVAQSLLTLDSSPIVSVHLWFPAPPFEEPWVGFVGGHFHWAVRRSAWWGQQPVSAGGVTLFASAARSLEKKTRSQLVELALEDLQLRFPQTLRPTHSAVTWEKGATPAPTPAFWAARPGVKTPLPNFFLAGDYVDVGLPPTIEAACRSGHRAAESVKAYLEGVREEVRC